MIRKDLPEVLDIERVSFPNPWRPSTFEGEIDNAPISNPYVIICGPGARIVGYVIYWHLKESVQISNISIHPDFRRVGVGENVMKRILKKIQNDGAEYIHLEVRPSNSAARALYEKLGFQILGVREGYYFDPTEEALIMGKRL